MNKKFWSEEEKNFLKENYHEFGPEWISSKLNRSLITVKVKASEFNLSFNKISKKYSKENLQHIVKQSKNIREILKQFGMTITGQNAKTIKKYILKHEIDISHFEKGQPLSRFLKRQTNDILVENSTYISTNTLKNRLYKEGLKERKCELCNQDEMWKDKKMSLILDHINGINNDNRLENLRIVCPNCNATLDTHCGKNVKKKDKGIKIKRTRLNRRKVERPSIEILLHDIRKLGFTGTGRKYGVSDNAIRKWIK